MPSRQTVLWWTASALALAGASFVALRSSPKLGSSSALHDAHGAAAPSGGLTPALPESFDVAALDAYVASQLEPRGIVGASLAIVRNGELVLARGYGKRSRETSAPATDTTPFAIGSVTKQFTCAAMFMMADEGKLSPQDKVAKYYPDLTRAEDITLDDLGSHLAGYPDYYPLDFPDRRMQRPIAADDLLRKYATGPLDFEPRTRWSYSNTGFVLMGRVVERVSGQPFGKLLAERIFGPLGMRHSSFSPPPSPELATGHTTFAFGEPEPTPREPDDWMHAAGAIYATAADLARWDLALMDRKLLSDASWRAMSSPRVLANGRSAEYGCGLQVRTEGGDTVLSHGGEVSGFLAFNTMIPRIRAAVVLLVNSDRADVGSLHRDIQRLVTKDESRVPAVKGPPAKEAAAALVRELQAGVVDRARLAEEYSVYLDERRLADASARLRKLGAPTKVTLLGQSERGGMEVSRVRLTFPRQNLVAVMFRGTDGRIEELLLSKE